MFLVNGGGIYVRNEVTSEWKTHFGFDHQIVALYPVGKNLNNQDELLVITEGTLETLTLSQTGDISKSLSQKLPGRPIRTQLSK